MTSQCLSVDFSNVEIQAFIAIHYSHTRCSWFDTLLGSAPFFCLSTFFQTWSLFANGWLRVVNARCLVSFERESVINIAICPPCVFFFFERLLLLSTLERLLKGTPFLRLSLGEGTQRKKWANFVILIGAHSEGFFANFQLFLVFYNETLWHCLEKASVTPVFGARIILIHILSVHIISLH